MLNKRIHAPVTGTMTYIVNKVGKHFRSLFGVKHFRMELNGVQFFRWIFSGCHRTICRMCTDIKSRCHLGNIIKMAHPAYSVFADICKQCRIGIYMNIGFSVLTNRCFLHRSAKHVHHQLSTVAKAEYRNTHFK